MRTSPICAPAVAAKDAENSHLHHDPPRFTQNQVASFHSSSEEGHGLGDANAGPLRPPGESAGAHAREVFRPDGQPGRIEDILQAGATKARKLSVPFMHELRQAVGLRNLEAASANGKGAPAKKEKGKGARFVSFRDEDGGFRFRLLAADGEELLLSRRFADPKEAGALMRRLQSEPADTVLKADAAGYAAVIDGVAVATAPAGAQGEPRPCWQARATRSAGSLAQGRRRAVDARASTAAFSPRRRVDAGTQRLRLAKASAMALFIDLPPAAPRHHRLRPAVAAIAALGGVAAAPRRRRGVVQAAWIKAMRLRAASTSSTFTLTVWPTRTTSRGSFTKVSDSAEMWIRPSWCTPISTKAPKAATLLTTPSSTMPGYRSFRVSTPSLNCAVLNSGRGSRPGFSSSAKMSRTVGRPKRSSVKSDGETPLSASRWPMICLTSALILATMRSTTG